MSSEGSAHVVVPVKPEWPKLSIEIQPHVGPLIPNCGLSKPTPLRLPYLI